MTSNQPEYKPCPFCGGEASSATLGSLWSVGCRICNIETPLCSSKDGAARLWNRRAPVPDPHGEDAGNQALVIMQLDMGYHRDYVPKYHRDPIRHQLAWSYASKAIGGDDKIHWINAEDRVKSGGVDCRTAPVPEPKPEHVICAESKTKFIRDLAKLVLHVELKPEPKPKQSLFSAEAELSKQLSEMFSGFRETFGLPEHDFTCPECGGHTWGEGWGPDDHGAVTERLACCHDGTSTRCNWSGPYEEYVKL